MRGAVEVAHGAEVDHHLARAALDPLPHLGEERGEHRVGQLGLLHADDGHVALLVERELHHLTSRRRATRGPGASAAPAAGRGAAAARAPRGPG